MTTTVNAEFSEKNMIIFNILCIYGKEHRNLSKAELRECVMDIPNAKNLFPDLLEKNESELVKILLDVDRQQLLEKDISHLIKEYKELKEVY